MRLKTHTAIFLKISEKSKSEEYGLVYFYRKGELEKVNAIETQVQPLL